MLYQRKYECQISTWEGVQHLSLGKGKSGALWGPLLSVGTSELKGPIITVVGETVEPSCAALGNGLVWETAGQCFSNLNVIVPLYDPVVLLLRMYLRERRARVRADLHLPMAAWFVVAGVWRKPWCLSTSEWTNRHVLSIQWNITEQ